MDHAEMLLFLLKYMYCIKKYMSVDMLLPSGLLGRAGCLVLLWSGPRASLENRCQASAKQSLGSESHVVVF